MIQTKNGESDRVKSGAVESSSKRLLRILPSEGLKLKSKREGYRINFGVGKKKLTIFTMERLDCRRTRGL